MTYGRTAVLGLLLSLTAITAFAQTDAQFYGNMLQRGLANAAAGNDEMAARELRIAAFGFLDAPPQFEIAQVHLALTYERLERDAEARVAAQRVVAAERLGNYYASLPLATSVRDRFNALARRLLTPDQVALLQRAPTAAPPAAPPATTVPPRTQPQTAQPEPQRRPVTPAPATPAPVTPAPQTTPRQTPAPQTPAPQTTAPPQARPVDVTARLAEGERLLARNSLPEARAIYREVLGVTSLDHATLIRVAEGAYRARDFEATVRAFTRLGRLRESEQPYRYYLAVALYETGDYAGARRELAAALPYIEVTGDVARYKAKIEGSVR
ncbi:MAG TPA: hypothetical protein VGF69_04450 [Thermoanaerobaculia bacterium]|jgi:hypothetical protein